MKANHIPVRERLTRRITGLEARLDASRKHRKGNPYYYCTLCGIHDPALYVPNGRHHKNCPMQGIEKQIEHFRCLLAEVQDGQHT